MTVYFSIGHSTRNLDAFVALLRDASVRVLVDVRSIPRSRTNPQYDRDSLPDALSLHQIGYEHVAALGGRRGRGHDIAPPVNGYWRVQAFHNYADYALGPEFAGGLARLRAIGAQGNCAFMCAEAVWWRCHRRIITDWLLAAGEDVRHILGPGHVDPARMTPGAVVDAQHCVTYPAAPAPAPG